MDNDAVAAVESGEDSIDSIPQPEYEAVEAGLTSSPFSPATDPLQTSEHDNYTHRVGGWQRGESFGVFDDGDVHSEDSFSRKSDINDQDIKDLDTSEEMLSEEIDKEYFKNCKRYRYDDTDVHTSVANDCQKLHIHNELKTHPITQKQPINTSHKLVQAKTKDNTLLLVELVNDRSKTITPMIPLDNPDLTALQIKNNTSNNSNVTPNSLQRPCNSPSLSREFLALQKSVNESKILKKFVTDITMEKARKRKTAGKNSSNKIPTKSLHHSESDKQNSKGIQDMVIDTIADASSIRQCVLQQRYLDNHSRDHGNTTYNQPHRESVAWASSNSVHKKRDKSKKSNSNKFVPLKDESSSLPSDTANDSSSSNRRSRSKSFTRKLSNDPEFYLNGCKVKRYPSAENFQRRTNMRSQNSDFVKKQIDFLDNVKRHGNDVPKEKYNDDADDEDPEYNRDSYTAVIGENANIPLTPLVESSINDARACSYSANPGGTSSDRGTPLSQISGAVSHGGNPNGALEKYLESIYQPPPKRGSDSFCWKCHQCVDLLACSKCVRSFHPSCIKITAATKLDNNWICPECVVVDGVLTGPKRTRRNDISSDLLNQLLSFALKRMRNVKGVSQFVQSSQVITSLPNIFVNPVTLETLQGKIDKKLFRCSEEFVNETKWMHHNALIIAGCSNSKNISTAKTILKVCRQEANEIDTCPECYLNANTRNDWFVDVCSQPHLLLWAKLKGFPYWPAKAMGLGQGSHVNVRFFGEHDRAFVPSKDCYLFSEQVPNSPSGKRSSRAGFAECIQEVEIHIERIRSKIGTFKYAPYKTLYDPTMEMQQLEMMIPNVQEYMKRQQSTTPTKPPLQYKIVKTADNNLSIIKKGTSTADSGTDSDHSLNVGSKSAAGMTSTSVALTTTSSSSHSKRKLQEHNNESSSAELSRPIKDPTTSNYEVISKIDSENSSKVNCVILKRKSEHGTEHRKINDIVPDSEFPLPKMTKIDEAGVDEERHISNKSKIQDNHASKKEKFEVVNKTPPLPQHSNSDQKIPVLTIKTNGNKIVESKETNDATGKTSEIANASKTVESFIKYKQGVTIKKITKDDIKKKQTEGAASPEKCTKGMTTDHDIVEIAKVTNEKSQDDTMENHKQDQSDGKKQILIDLIPFVEIKKEIFSDDENDISNVSNTVSAANTIDQTPNVVIGSTSIVANTATESITEVNLNSTILPNTSLPNNPTNTADPPPPAQESRADSLLLGLVKNEVLSDGEETAICPISSTVNKLPAEPSSAINIPIANVVSASLIESVRVVGGTTIQRISTKFTTTTTNSLITTQAHLPSSQSHGHSPAVTTISPSLIGLPQTISTITGLQKRPLGRGIPYGPLPSTATPTVKTSTPQLESIFNTSEKQTILQQQKSRPEQQRARKSFPNRSPTGISPIRGGGITPPSPAAISVSTAASSGVVDPKRILSKTSMVSIPVDIATNRCSSSAIIPVPPLTAVTKVVPPTNPLNSMSGSAVSVSVPTFINCNGPTATVTLSAPPPLAGLSYNTFIATTATTATMTSTSSNQIFNGIGIASGSPSSIGTSIGANNHVEPLGMTDFVTPTMASTITEAICRGPPRMIPRPNGPLQSEGSTMFPSQAGPVCRTLVENAHKLTDFFISVMEDTMSEMAVDPEPVLQAKITLLTLELERSKQTYERDISELKRTSDLMLCEMRKNMEVEKARIAAEVRKQCELERKRSIEETKKKQWCANCGRESQFHCCWNTSYCDYPCQQQHWSRHAASCAQTRPSANETTATNSHNATGNASNQMERHYSGNKSLTTITTNTSSHYSTKSASKKDKSSLNKSGSTVVVSNTMSGANTAPTEILKLPTNTYLRPVGSSTNVRIPYTAQTSVQRFNIPLPIPAPTNPGPYTLIQREGNWELMSAATTKPTQVMALQANPLQAPVSAHHHYQPSPAQQQPQQQARLIANTATLSTKSPARARGGVNNLNSAAAALQPIGGGVHLSGSGLQCSGPAAIRPNQM